MVLTMKSDAISSITGFPDVGLADYFGMPSGLAEDEDRPGASLHGL
jgi:hypothetical protein